MARTTNYKKTHKNKKALAGHKKNIEKRGGSATVFGSTIEYDFPKNKKKAKRKKRK